MDKISEAAKRKACELAKRHFEEYLFAPYDDGSYPHITIVALARVLQEHSDVARKAHAVLDGLIGTGAIRDGLQSLILPDEPDPLEEVIGTLRRVPGPNEKHDTEWFRAALAARGLKIVEAGNG